MQKILVIAKKELSAYFKSPIAYILLVIAISIFNILFFVIIDQNKEATLRDIFLVMEFIFLFIIPLLTMKIFSEEKSSGTWEFLITTPTPVAAVVWGKYLGSLVFFSILIALTFIYYLIIEIFGQPDRFAVLTGYFGLWLEGAMFIAIGTMTSAWTRNQIVSAISSYAIIFCLYLFLSLTKYVDGAVESVIVHLSTMSHSANFFIGLIQTEDLVYYLSGIIFCLIVTRLSVDASIWN